MSSKRKVPHQRPAAPRNEALERYAVKLAEILVEHVPDDLVFVLLLGQKVGGERVCLSGINSEGTAILLRSALEEVETAPMREEPRGKMQ